MRRAVLIAAIIAAFLCSCASYAPDPSPSHPMPVCRISCASGRWLSRQQHVCVGSTFFEDALATERVTTRNVDGTANSDVYVTHEGDFAAEDTVRGTCQSVIQMRVLAREPDQRGIHPGEPDPLHPNNQ